MKNKKRNNKLFFNFKKEEGSSIVQLMMVLLILIPLIFSIMQIGLMMYSGSVIYSQIQNASWTIDLEKAEELRTKEKQNEYVKEVLIEGLDGVLVDNLKVTDTKVVKLDDKKTEKALKETDDPFGFGHIKETQERYQIQCTVSYDIPAIINAFGLGNQTIKQLIDHTQIINQEVEVYE